MKIANNTFILLTSLVLLISVSCTKDRTKDDTGITLGSTDAFYKNNALEEQSFIIDSIHGDTIRGKDGTKIFHISKTLFMFRDTRKDITYPFTLKLIEAYSIQNMILAQLPNVAQNKILKSGGEIKVTAFKNNRELVLKSGKGLNLIMPAKIKDPEMTVFYGFTKGSTNDWNDNVLNTSDYLFNTDSVTNSFPNTNYWFQIAKLGWINCDAFYNYPDKTDIAFAADTSITGTQYIDLYVIFKNIHSVMRLYSFTANNMPVGEPITVFALAKGEDLNGVSYFYFMKDYIITSGLKINITLTSATESEILDKLKSL